MYIHILIFCLSTKCPNKIYYWQLHVIDSDIHLRHSNHKFDHKAFQSSHHISNKSLITKDRGFTRQKLQVQKLHKVSQFRPGGIVHTTVTACYKLWWKRRAVIKTRIFIAVFLIGPTPEHYTYTHVFTILINRCQDKPKQYIKTIFSIALHRTMFVREGVQLLVFFMPSQILRNPLERLTFELLPIEGCFVQICDGQKIYALCYDIQYM